MDDEMIEQCSDAVDRLTAFDFNNFERHAIVTAVIKAMLQPTGNILGAIHGCYPDVPDKLASYYAKLRWQAAINAIVGD